MYGPDATETLHRMRRDRTLHAVVALAVLAVAARLVQLAARVAHYDEGWVAYWVLRYTKTGIWEYRPLVHGPFFPHVNRAVFTLVGANDFTARFVVAVLGGALPLAALLLRDRLDRTEVVALAGLLAANPILLYYSRFMRFDFPLATFMLFALGFGIRAVDRSNPRYLYPAAACLALGMTTKESWLLYYAAWFGAGVLALDSTLLQRDRGLPAALLAGGERTVAGLRAWGRQLAGSVAVFSVVLVFFYAPRAGPTDGPGLWKAFANPGTVPAVVEAATLGSLGKLADFWIQGDLQQHPYLPYLGDYLATMVEGAVVVLVFAAVGFVVDRHVTRRRRTLVAFATFWGLSNVVGYPLANFLKTPWSTVHAVVPLAIPAAVGLAAVFRYGRSAYDADGRAVPVVAACVLLLCASSMAVTGYQTSYLRPQDDRSELVYLSQPEGHIKPTLAVIERVSRSNEGTDVLYYGDYYNMSDEGIAERPPAWGGWHGRLPLPWYFEYMNVTHDSTARPEALGEDTPPVVVSKARNAEVLSERLDGYRSVTFNLTQINKRTVFMVDEDAMGASG